MNNGMRHFKPKQRGIVLVMGLLVLAVLMVLVLTALENSLIHDKITGSSQHHAQALATAELAMQAAEQDLQTVLANNPQQAFDGSTIGLIAQQSAGVSRRFWQTYDWQHSRSATTSNGLIIPRYVIEQFPYQSLAGESVALRGDKTGVSMLRVYRLTVRVLGRGGVVIFVQQHVQM